MNNKLIIKLTEKIIENYNEAECSLNYNSPFELLVAVVLSAQCTDERVNIVTKELFKKYSTAKKFANADIKDIEKLIYSVGFYKNKAKNIVNAGKVVEEKFKGKIPSNLKDLLEIPGVGRKTANVVLLELYGKAEGIAVDTHVGRIARRLGFANSQDNLKVEQELLEKIPQKYWGKINHTFIWHGRKLCLSQKPKCENCFLKNECQYYLKDKEYK